MSGRSRSRLLMVLERERPSIQTHGDEILRVGGWLHNTEGVLDSATSMYSVEEKPVKEPQVFLLFQEFTLQNTGSSYIHRPESTLGLIMESTQLWLTFFPLVRFRRWRGRRGRRRSWR